MRGPRKQGHDSATIGATPLAELVRKLSDDFDRRAAARETARSRARRWTSARGARGPRSTVLSGRPRRARQPDGVVRDAREHPRHTDGRGDARPGSAPPARRLGGWGKSSPAVHPGLAHEPPTSPRPSPTPVGGRGAASEGARARAAPRRTPRRWPVRPRAHARLRGRRQAPSRPTPTRSGCSRRWSAPRPIARRSSGSSTARASRPAAGSACSRPG